MEPASCRIDLGLLSETEPARPRPETRRPARRRGRSVAALLPATLLLGGLLPAAPLGAATGDDTGGEVRLYLIAAFTGRHERDWKTRSAGPEASHTVTTLRDDFRVVFEGTSIWRVSGGAVDGRTLSHNCTVTAEGGGWETEVVDGTVPCSRAGDDAYHRDKRVSWRYSLPSRPQTTSPAVSPAGAVNVIPAIGSWMLIPFAQSNLGLETVTGQGRVRYTSCDENTDEAIVVGTRDYWPNLSPTAVHLVRDAWEQTFGSRGGHEPYQGRFEPASRGFLTSGEIHEKGGEGKHPVGAPPSGDPEDAYFTGTEEMVWTADVHWTLSYTQKPPPVELVIEKPAGYDTWVPGAGADQNAPGNGLLVTARLQVKGKPGETPLQSGQFRFQLTGVSSEPGIALNAPLGNAGREPDLKLEKVTAADLEEKDGVATTVGTDLKAAAVKVRAYDNGAWGTLKVTARLKDGSVVYGHLEGKPGQEELTIPLDDDRNHVADGWEKGEGILGEKLPADWDGQETPGLDGRPGDGLTLYEEYRGLVHRGAPLRLSARTKNLVVENRVGDLVRPGLALFDTASGLNVAEVDEKELPEDRAVNRNHGTGFKGVQHGLRLVSEPLGAGVVGLAWPDREKLNPGDCERVAVNSDLSFIPAGARGPMVKVGVAHELGHALGVQHHGDSDPGCPENEVIDDATSEVSGSDGALVTDRPYTLVGVTETRSSGGESSGAEECVMRNSSYFQWVRHLTRNGSFHYYAVPPTPPGTAFCDTIRGTGINESGGSRISYFGDAKTGRGECTKHMHVRDY